MLSKRTLKLLALFVPLLPLLLLLTAAGISRAAPGAIIIVDTLLDEDDGCKVGGCSLRDAIADATAGDTIVFAVSGMINIAGNGELVINKSLTISSSLPITVNGGSITRVFYIAARDVTFTGLTIANGTSSSSDAGGIYNASNLTVNNCTFSGNSSYAGNGGGILNMYILTVNNSTFSGNWASEGGGIYNMYMVTVNNSTFIDNSAYIGGAIDHRSGILTVNNSTFSGNVGYFGGAIANSSTVTVSNSTFSGNRGNSGSCILGGNALHLYNSVLANSGGDVDCRSNHELATNVHNLIETHSGCGTPYSSADPQLAPLGAYGGSTLVYALSPGSPAINAGDETSCLADDQRGVPRPQLGVCDIGSFELEPTNLFYLPTIRKEKLEVIENARLQPIHYP